MRKIVRDMSSRKPVVNLPFFDWRSVPLSASIVCIGAPGSGKCLDPEEEILMWNFTKKKAKDVEIGDVIRGDNGDLRIVMNTCEGEDDMYSITQYYSTHLVPEHERTYTVNSPHILVLARMDEDTGVYILTHISAKELAGMDEGERSLYKGVCFGKHGDSLPKDPCDPTYTSLTRESIARVARESGWNVNVDDEGVEYVDYGVDIWDPFSKDKNKLRKGVVCDIDVSAHGVGAYCGFQLREYDPDSDRGWSCKSPEDFGKARFLLGDYTVTHNTTFMLNAMYYLQDRYPIGTAFIGSQGAYKDVSKVMHPLYVRGYYNTEEIRDIVIRQTVMDRECGSGYLGTYQIMIIDDCTDDRKKLHSKTIKNLFKQGSRHYHQLFILGLHAVTDFPADTRKAPSYVVMFEEHNIDDKEKLYKKMGGGLAGSKENFYALVDAATGDYKCLIMKQRNPSRNLEDNFYWYQTQPDDKMPGFDKFKLGCREYRAWADQRYDKNHTINTDNIL